MERAQSESLALPGRRPLGDSGIEVTPLAWGMWRFKGADLAAADRRVRTALDLGFSLFDTADVYGLDSGEPFGAAEALLGRVFTADRALRARVVLASKGGIIPGIPYDSSARYLVAACEASLRRLNTDVIDLYQIHRPDVLTHPREVAEALVSLRESGKIRAAGVSNYSASQTAALQAYVPFALASHQPELSALCIEPLRDGVLDQALERNMAVLAWSPLAGGRLAGGRVSGSLRPGDTGAGASTDASAGADDRSRAVLAALDLLAEREGVARSAVALAWVMAHPARPIALVGSQDVDHLNAASGALEVKLTRADWYAVLAASRQAPLP